MHYSNFQMLKSNINVLIIRHPQEPNRKDQEISTANLITDSIGPSFVATGLSFKNLNHALTRSGMTPEQASTLAVPQDWVTLYLGTKSQTAGAKPVHTPGLYFLSKKGLPKERPSDIKPLGIILLDGTWSQAKTLWWRNAWLLKTQRAYLVPKQKSLYKSLRKEPRPECVSSLEALAEALTFLGEPLETEMALKDAFKAKINTYANKNRSS